MRYDPRNADILVWVDDGLKPRAEARVSVFDSVVQGGDAVWEGLRVYDGKIAELAAHLDRLTDSARAMAFEHIPSHESIRSALFKTLEANRMRDGAHVRLTLTRGEKLTSGMNPRHNQSGSCLIVLAEWKLPIHGTRSLELVSSSVRRNSPQCLDSKIHHNNLINNILACIEANAAGADGGLMLDLNGYVAETNDANVFLVKGGRLVTPTADSCLPGITRRMVIESARGASIPLKERNVSLTEIYVADEVFTTGTMGELAPVAKVDGRPIGDAPPGPITRRLQELHARRVRERGEPLPF
ncbi:D-amino acid aminotransferase [soil metagenome]